MSVYEQWQKCPHHPKKTRGLKDLETGYTYEICDECHISRRATGPAREGIEKP